MKGCAPRLGLKKRQKTTPKWPITDFSSPDTKIMLVLNVSIITRVYFSGYMAETAKLYLTQN